MKMVERMAAAMYERYDNPGSFAWAEPEDREWFLSAALAALKAMRSPSDAMEKAYYAACDEYGHCLWKSGYQAMIDAAIKEAESE